ncbi:hypothetical protein BJ684DRAFT_17225 [Piptocephalis cylindrospora]|uniref:Protein kinase domain-containing protein n=1 Tax=Piptocephalis cylindrospora TaxID=1907219 RepID=A0A4P9Y2J0_9FUNG|nr:hypothetical protein BJ684DRAFT_17225 [Piptocephalis cylindrospora]|eukprot:RKP12271.1 hypothetical protein BJ684DRAFT_17225 [Piptocephalis cylindrospora]
MRIPLNFASTSDPSNFPGNPWSLVLSLLLFIFIISNPLVSAAPSAQPSSDAKCPKAPFPEPGKNRVKPYLPQPNHKLTDVEWGYCASLAVKDAFNVLYLLTSRSYSSRPYTKSLGKVDMKAMSHAFMQPLFKYSSITTDERKITDPSGHSAHIVSATSKITKYHNIKAKLISKSSENFYTARDFEDEVLNHVRAFAVSSNIVARPLDFVIEDTKNWILALPTYDGDLSMLLGSDDGFKKHISGWKADGTLPEVIAHDLMYDLIKGLAAIDAAGVHHRDLHEKNILFTAPEKKPTSKGKKVLPELPKLVLTDFGSSVNQNDEDFSTTHHRMGSYHATPPEAYQKGSKKGIPGHHKHYDSYSIAGILFRLVLKPRKGHSRFISPSRTKATDKASLGLSEPLQHMFRDVLFSDNRSKITYSIFMRDYVTPWHESMIRGERDDPVDKVVRMIKKVWHPWSDTGKYDGRTVDWWCRAAEEMPKGIYFEG